LTARDKSINRSFSIEERVAQQIKQKPAAKFEESKILNFNGITLSNMKPEGVTSPSEDCSNFSHQTSEKATDKLRYVPMKQQKDTLDFEETKISDVRKGAKRQEQSSGDEVPIPLYLAIVLRDSKQQFSSLLEEGVSSLLLNYGPESGDLRNTCESLL
jgi:hypothetical protein